MNDFPILVGGRLVTTARRMSVINPATGEIFADCARAGEDDVHAAIAAARQSFPSWRDTPVDERAEKLHQLAEGIALIRDDLSVLLTREQGKPLAEAEAEVNGTVRFLHYFADQRLPEKRFQNEDVGDVRVRRRPLGVVAGIVPWNYPLMIAAFKFGPALMAGNTCIIKPAPTTPLTVLRMAQIAEGIFPSGALNVVTDVNDLGSLLSRHGGIDKVSFTGSTATGKNVIHNTADTIKRLTLELGGNDPGIVLDDVNVGSVASQLFQSAFINSGQDCVALKRLYVHDSIHDDICSALKVIAQRTVVGDGLDPTTTMGPIQNRAQFDRVLEYLELAADEGSVVTGGHAIGDHGYFVEPTIVIDVKDGCRLVDEERFGPILPIIRYNDVEEALEWANGTRYGLGGSVWSADQHRATKIAERLECGSAWVNQHGTTLPSLPFGGVKESGLGVELGEEGLLEFTSVQVMSVLASRV